MTDEEIVRRILDGEGALFEVLVRRYNQRLYRAVRAILPVQFPATRCDRVWTRVSSASSP